MALRASGRARLRRKLGLTWLKSTTAKGALNSSPHAGGAAYLPPLVKGGSGGVGRRDLECISVYSPFAP